MSDTTVKLVLHYLNKQNTDRESSFSVPTTNEFLSQIANRGYDLVSSHYVGDNPEGYGVLYVFVKRPVVMRKAKEASLED